jgi:hypothetical protein
MSSIPHPKLSDKPNTDYILLHTALKGEWVIGQYRFGLLLGNWELMSR